MRDVERLIRLAGRRPEASEDGRARARAAVHDAWAEAVESRTRRRWVWIAAPALAAAAIVLAVVAPWRAPATAGQTVVGAMNGAAVLAGSMLRTGAGELAVVKMEGGGEVRLNSGTTIRMTGPRLMTLERGQIYVDAGGPSLADLAVTTPAGVLRDIGTRFDVRVDDAGVRVRVRDGLVRLTAGGRDTDARAGQQLLARPGMDAVLSAAVTSGADWDWILSAAPFHANGARLDAFLRWVETEGGVPVVFADPTLRNRIGTTVLHGSIAHLGLEEALGVILPACGLTHRLEGGRIVITSATGVQ